MDELKEESDVESDFSYDKGPTVGQGASSIVSRALHHRMGKIIIIKTLKYEGIIDGTLEDRYEYIQQKASEIKMIKSKHIIKYMKISEVREKSEIDIAMEFVPGGGLRHILDFFGSFKEKLVKSYTLQILNGLKSLHNLNLIHGDLNLK